MPLHELLRSAERYQARLQDDAGHPRRPAPPPIERASVRRSWFRETGLTDEMPRARLEPEDRELVLDLARRLALGHPRR